MKEEADAWRSFEAALTAAAEPLQAAMAAALIAKKHGGKASGDRGDAARKALASVLGDGVFAEASIVPGVRERIDALLEILTKAKISTRAIELPELPAPPVPFVPDFRIVKLPESTAREAQPGLVRMGRDVGDEVDAVGRRVAQSARPPAGYVEERPIAGFTSGRPTRTADPHTVERVSVFRTQRSLHDRAQRHMPALIGLAEQAEKGERFVPDRPTFEALVAIAGVVTGIRSCARAPAMPRRRPPI